LFILFVNCMCISILSNQTTSHSAKNIKEIFEQEYRAYIDAIELDNKEFPFRSTSYGPRSYQYLHKIAKIGTPVLPYLMEKAAETEDMSLSLPINIITRKAFLRSEWPEAIPIDSRGEIKLYVNWWRNGRKLTHQQFGKRYSQWKKLKGEGKEDEAGKKTEEIRALGIAALPMLLDKIKQGDKELISIISKLTKAQVDPNTSISQCFAWWVDNKEKWLIPFLNKKPKAHAGQNQTVNDGDIVKLDGSASSDADKDDLTYRWTQIAGPPVKLLDEMAAKPTFTAPQVMRPTLLIFQLTVNDGSPKESVHPSCESGESDPNPVNIIVRPKD
jgi:hypothetical protein